MCLILDAFLMKISLVLRGALSENKLKNTEMAQRDFFLCSLVLEGLFFYMRSPRLDRPLKKTIAPSNFLVKYLLQAEKFDIEKTK